ncbi:MAG: hypothetical protein ACLQMT_00795 [Candidatus Acidiferrales bacterium]
MLSTITSAAPPTQYTSSNKEMRRRRIPGGDGAHVLCSLAVENGGDALFMQQSVQA